MLALIALHTAGLGSIVMTLLFAGLVIWLLFYVLPLPPVVRTILAVIVAVVLILMLLPGCAGGRYIGPPITVSGGYEGFNGSVHIDPSFATQKK